MLTVFRRGFLASAAVTAAFGLNTKLAFVNPAHAETPPLVIFTHPDGTPVGINPDAVAAVHPTVKTQGYHVGTMIDSTGAGSEVVTESFEEVVKRLSTKDCK